jgi:hypothetical protein
MATYNGVGFRAAARIKRRPSFLLEERLVLLAVALSRKS